MATQALRSPWIRPWSVCVRVLLRGYIECSTASPSLTGTVRSVLNICGPSNRIEGRTDREVREFEYSGPRDRRAKSRGLIGAIALGGCTKTGTPRFDVCVENINVQCVQGAFGGCTKTGAPQFDVCVENK